MFRHALFLLLTLVPLALSAQKGNGAQQSFQQFRQQVMQRYDQHRKSVLSHYADFLQQTWQHFEDFKGEKLPFDRIPKPLSVPMAPKAPTTTPIEPVTPTEPMAPAEPTLPTAPPTPSETPPAIPAKTPVAPQQPMLTFSFYGANLQAPQLKMPQLASQNEKDIAAAWRALQANEHGQQGVQALLKLAHQQGLNDWLAIEMVRTYTKALLPAHEAATQRIVLQQFLLTHMGWDVRMGRTERQLVLLIPTQQIFYNQPYLGFEGQRFYIFKDRLAPIDEAEAHYATYTLPADADAGHVANLLFKANNCLALHSGQELPCTLTDGRLTLQLTVDKGMMEALRHYPPMDVPCYAQSVVSSTLHKAMWQQLRTQLEGKSQREMVEALMHFAQYAFQYATDGEQHGYEKPYFVEENFYYPKNDCEDRAIFLACAVRELLGLPVHLVQYPGHECTAIHFTDASVTGHGYNYKGQRFIICDPTYIGAGLGQCMPNYLQTEPLVQEW